MFMRRSKFKHVFGKPNKKDFCYEDIRITKSSWDSTFCSVNPKYIAIITEAGGGGAFLVHPVEKYGRVERDTPLVAGHTAAVLDIQWCPHNDDLIASASEDCTVKVWQIPEGGLPAKANLTEPIADLVQHKRRVGLVVWHPTAEHVLVSAGADNLVIVWNVATEEALVEISFPDMVLSANFNTNGSKLVTTCKDRVTRIVNPRNGEIIREGVCHQGSKPQQAVYIKHDKIFTTGFSPMSERQYGLWKDDDLAEPLNTQDIDTSNGVLFIFYDADTNMVYLCGKGDSTIRYFEITDEEPYVHYINMLTSSDPQRGMGLMPKRGLNVNQNEISRFYKLHARGLCEVIPFTVPRKSELFQDDLYPDTAGDIPAITADEWLTGKDAEPILVSLKEGFQGKEKSTKKPVSKTAIKSSALSKIGGAAAAAAAKPAAAAAATTTAAQPTSNALTPQSQQANNATKTETTPPPQSQPGTNMTNGTQPASNVVVGGVVNAADVQQLLEDMRKMKIIIKGHERRIKYLEERVASLQSTDGSTMITSQIK